MRFSRNRRVRQNQDDAILPLVNVVFLLLIFFMLAGRLATPQAANINPPRSVSDTAAQTSGLEIQLTASGNLALDGQSMSLDALKRRVQQRMQAQPETPLRLKADGAGNAARVVTVMHALHDAGAKKLRLITVAVGT